MRRVFLIPGLGADERLFKNINLNGFDIMPVKWVEPEVDDSLHSYAQKIISHYQIDSSAIIISVSLGGMIASEIARILKPRQAIIISSVKSALEIPWYLKVFRFAPVYKLVPHCYFKGMGTLFRPFFGIKSKTDKFLFNSMLSHSSPTFMKWAVGAILNWNANDVPSSICHIVGDKDRILPRRYVKNAIVISGGTHMMVLDKADQINQIIRECLNT